MLIISCFLTIRFQSTPPARGATQALIGTVPSGFISIHAPREGGDFTRSLFTENKDISIHAPREGGDIDIPNRHTDDTISIHAPREGGDHKAPGPQTVSRISIHAPREGGDSKDAQFYL